MRGIDDKAQPQVQRSLRNSIGVDWLSIARLSARLPDLRVDISKCEGVGSNRRRLTPPWSAAVDAQLHRSKKPRFAEVVPRQTLIVPALSARIDDDQ